MDTQPLLARFDNFVLDEANARVERDGVAVDLPPRAFGVLCALVRQEGRLVVKNALLDEVWGHQHVSESVLKTTISQLRAALADDPKTPRYIETAPRRGYRFIASTLGAAPAPPPPGPAAHITTAPGTPIVGREAALAVLDAGLDSVSAGACRLVLVAGEPGIGKSTLVARFLQVHPEVRQAVGQCIEAYGTGEPYLPVLDALNGIARGAGAGELVDLMRRVAPTWLVQLPWLMTDADRASLQREVGGATQQRMLRELGELLDRYTAQRPLLLALEDLHWSDEATVQLLGYLARRRGSARLLVVGTLRPAEVIASGHPLHGLRQELHAHRLYDEIDLETFSEAEVADYIQRRMGAGVASDALVRDLHSHTDGLPLFVASVVDAMLAGGTQEALAIPRNVVSVVERQIAMLPSATREWLTAASVASSVFTDHVLAEAVGVPLDTMRVTLDGLARIGQWLRLDGVMTVAGGRTATRYGFRHALYRHAFYQSLGQAQRVHWHGHWMAAIERVHGASAVELLSAELAMHAERAHDLPRAIGYLQMGAARALSRFAPAEAAGAAHHALELLAQLPESEANLGMELELRVLEGVALAQQTVFSEPTVAVAFDRAQVLVDRLPASPARARALHGLWWVQFGRGELARARTLAERILRLGEDANDISLKVAGHGSLGMTLTHMGEVPLARTHLEHALAAYREAGSALSTELFVQDPGVEALSYLALLAWWMGSPSEARGFMREAEVAAERSRHPPTQAIALHISAVVYSVAREYETVLRKTEQIYRLVEGHWLAGGPSAHGWIYGRALVALGRTEEGLEAMRAAAERCRASGLRIGLPGYYQMYADALRTVGRLGDALESVEAGLAAAGATGEHWVDGPLLRVRGELRREKGEADAARADLEAAMAYSRERRTLQHELEATVAWARLPQVPAREKRRALDDLIARYGNELTWMLDEARRLRDAVVTLP
ncbi:AAA family ATPase [Ramlibacter albus]|nr:AAA family ATPase [Ramlibacter albus]